MESFLWVLYLDGTEAFDSVYLDPPADPEGNTEGVLELETGRTDSTAFDIQSVTYTFTGGVSPELSARSEATLDQETCTVTENRARVIRE